MVDEDGKNFYPTNAIWMTDGYGDYVRHYLRAMAAAPWLAPEKDVLLHSSSIIQDIRYGENEISYRTFDANSVETFKLMSKKTKVTGADSHSWQPLKTGGYILTIKHSKTRKITIRKDN